jgi:peptidoglycan/LPS O-acetylase OafA/YrhL
LVAIIFLLAAWATFDGSALADWFVYIFPPTRFLEFVLGVIVALQLKHGKHRPRVSLVGAIVVVLVAYCADAFLPEAFTRVAVTVVPFMLIVWAAARADMDGRWSPFRAKFIVMLGVWSYAFYLIHNQVIRFIYVGIERIGIDVERLGGLPLAALVLVMLAAAIAIAGALHRLVEAPAERWLRPQGAPPRMDDHVPTP